MTEQPVPVKRRRGGQAGNKNALKHGFYAGNFNRGEIKDLQTLDTINLQNEINMIRVFMRRIGEKTNPESTVGEDIEVLRTLALASHCLERLVRTQKLHYRDSDALSQALAESLKIVHEEMQLAEKYDPPLFPPKPPGE